MKSLRFSTEIMPVAFLSYFVHAELKAAMVSSLILMLYSVDALAKPSKMMAMKRLRKMKDTRSM